MLYLNLKQKPLLSSISVEFEIASKKLICFLLNFLAVLPWARTQKTTAHGQCDKNDDWEWKGENRDDEGEVAEYEIAKAAHGVKQINSVGAQEIKSLAINLNLPRVQATIDPWEVLLTR